MAKHISKKKYPVGGYMHFSCRRDSDNSDEVLSEVDSDDSHLYFKEEESSEEGRNGIDKTEEDSDEHSVSCDSEQRNSPKSEPDPRPIAPPGRGTNKRKARGGGRGRIGKTRRTSICGMDGTGVEGVKPSQPILRPHDPPGTSTRSSQTRTSGKQEEYWNGSEVENAKPPQPILRPDPPLGTSTRNSQTNICGISQESGRGHGQRGGTETARTDSTQTSISVMTKEAQNAAGVQFIKPPKPIFRPHHPPGTKLLSTTKYTPLQIFQLFFTKTILKKIIRNTNEFGAAHRPATTTPWTDLSVKEMFSFMALVLYMGLIKCCSITDYWRGGKLYKLPFPRSVMTCKRFLQIRHALHFSSSADDAANEKKKGTPDYDSLCKIKPLYEELRAACKHNYHPSENISINERVVVTKSGTAQKQNMRREPTYWGYNLFVLVDGSSGYKWDFFVCERRSQKLGNKGPSGDSVLEGYYKILHKTQKWYKTFFFHFMDIAFANAFTLHKDHAARRGDVPFIQKEFREALVLELADAGLSITDEPESNLSSKHLPVHISGDSTAGRLRCRYCQAKTPIKCNTCKMPLCFVPGRDCYNAWHIKKGM